jgi:(E)-4-hydroxy-3-methylbut-2-enyl-diphosphate synthase
VHEIPVAQALVHHATTGRQGDPGANDSTGSREDDPAERLHPPHVWDPFSYERRRSHTIERHGLRLGGEELVRVLVHRATFDQIAHKIARMGDYQPELIVEDADVHAIDPRDRAAIDRLNALPEPELVTVDDETDLPVIAAFRLLASELDPRHPILLKDAFRPPRKSSAQADFLDHLLTAAVHLGSLLCDGIGDAIVVQSEEAPGQALRLSYNVLQAAGARIFKTDYVACPSCGRTLFDLQTTTARIKAATSHLKGVKIAVMGCIVNGPGEMADADFGYVGGAPGKINLYVGKQPVKFNIPENEAVDRLKDLIREHGKWVEPPVTPMLAEA